MTDFTVNVRRDENDTGSNNIQVFLDTARELKLSADQDGHLEEDVALYYAVERIAQLEAERAKKSNLTMQVVQEKERAAELQQERDTLAAHVESMTRLWMGIYDCKQNSDEQYDLISEMFDVIRAFENDATTSLACRDLIKQAEVLELAESAMANIRDAATLRLNAEHLRQLAQEATNAPN